MPSVPLPEGVMGLAQVPNGSIQALNQTKRIGYMGMAAKAAGTQVSAEWTKPKTQVNQ